MLLIFCFVKSSQNLMGERHIQIHSKKIWENKNKFKIAKRLSAYHPHPFHLWTSPNVKIQDKWYHFSEVLYSLPDHLQVLSSAQNHITCWIHLSSALITHCLTLLWLVSRWDIPCCIVNAFNIIPSPLGCKLQIAAVHIFL